MDQGNELEQEELNVLSAPVVEKCQLRDSSASSLSGFGDKENKNSKVSDTTIEDSVVELQLQNIPITSFSPQLGIENLKVTKAVSISPETLSKNLNEGHEVDFKMSDSQFCKRNATETDKGLEKASSSYTLANVTDNPPPSENVSFIDLTVDSDEEQQNELQRASSALIARKVSGWHLSKSRHVPYSAKLSKHIHLRTISCANQKPADHVSAHIDSVINFKSSNEKFGATGVTDNLVSASDQLNMGEGTELDLEPSTCTMSKYSPKKLEIKTSILADGKDACQINEPMCTSLHIEVDLGCPLVNDDSINACVTETSFCFENMSLHIFDEETYLTEEAVVSAETAAGVASIKLPGECEQSFSINMIASRNVQQQIGSDVDATSGVLSKNVSVTNFSKNALHTSSVENNNVENREQNSSALHVHASKNIQQQKNCDMTTSLSDNIQLETHNSADICRNMPLGISNDSTKNIKNSITSSSSKNLQQTSRSANASNNLQKENCADVIPSSVQQRINAKDASENIGQKINSAAALKKFEQKTSNPVTLSLNAQQSGNTVDASKNKQRVSNSTTATKSIQPQNSCVSNLHENVQQNSSSAMLTNMKQATINAENLSKTMQQQNDSTSSTFDAQLRSGSTIRSKIIQPSKHSGTDFSKGTQKENDSTKLSQAVQKQSKQVFKHPIVLKPRAQGENIISSTKVSSGKVDSSQDKKSLKKTETTKTLLSVTNIHYQPLQDCQNLRELASCKTTDYRVQQGKPKHILEESTRTNTFERFKNFQFSRAADKDVMELYGRLPMVLPEDLEETPICKEDIVDFTSKKNKVQDLEKVLLDQRR